MEAKPIKDRKGYFCLYDSDGDLCGSVNTEAGRAIIGRAFYHKVRTCRVCTLHEPEINRDWLLEIADRLEREYPDSRDAAVCVMDDAAKEIREAVGA